MKKILLLLFAALLGGVNVANAEEVIIATDVNDGAKLEIATIEDAGGIDTDIVTFYFEDISGSDHTGWGAGGFSKSSDWSGADEEFKGNGTSWTQEYTVARIKEVANGETGIRIRFWSEYKITKIVLNATLTSFNDVDPISITYGEGGFIAASEFDGLVDTDRIRFTYTVSGDISEYTGWGIGSIGSNDDPHTVKIADLPASALGDLTFTCQYADIKTALAKTPDGILFKTWDFGGGKATATRKKVEILKSRIPVTFPAGKTLISYSPSTGTQLDVTDVDGLKAYIVSDVTKTAVNLSETKGVIGDGTGYILEGTAGATYNLPVVASAPSYVGLNKLYGSGDTPSSVEAKSVYVLSNGKFCLFTGTEIPEHKAYLKKDDVPTATEAHELTLVFGDDDATAIKNIKVGTEDNVYYDLQGRRVLYPTKGLYIVNGKKVIVK